MRHFGFAGFPKFTVQAAVPNHGVFSGRFSSNRYDEIQNLKPHQRVDADAVFRKLAINPGRFDGIQCRRETETGTAKTRSSPCSWLWITAVQLSRKCIDASKTRIVAIVFSRGVGLRVLFDSLPYLLHLCRCLGLIRD